MKIGDYLIILAVALVAVIITVGLFRGEPMLFATPPRSPSSYRAHPHCRGHSRGDADGAVGDHGGRHALLAKKEAIVTRLAAIEELAGVDVLCSDKTGTLTQNKLTLGDPFSVNGIPADQVILDAALASRAEDKDTIDLAVIGGLKNDQSMKGYQVVHFQPFDPVHNDRGHRQGRGRKTVQGGQGSAAGDSGDVEQHR